MSRVELTAMAPYKTLEKKINKPNYTALAPISEERVIETDTPSKRPNPCINQEL